MNKGYISFLAPQIEQYEKFFSITHELSEPVKHVLRSFDQHCAALDGGEHCLTQHMVDTWCSKHDLENDNTLSRRIYRLNSFLKYLMNRGKANISPLSPPKMVIRKAHPYIFREGELNRFFSACDSIEIARDCNSLRLRKETLPIIFRLLYSTGMRPQEARQLERTDVDLRTGVVNIKETKGYIEHYVVLHESMRTLMERYDETAGKYCPDRKYFFQSLKGSCFSNNWLCYAFETIWQKANGIHDKHPTPYSFRHYYAITNINSWVNEGYDFFDKIVILSKSMGHAEIRSTLYYYSYCPRFAHIIEETGSTRFNEMIPEVIREEE